MKCLIFLTALLLAACGSDIRPVTQDHDSAVPDSDNLIITDNVVVDDDTLVKDVLVEDISEESVVPDEDGVIDEVVGDDTDMDHLNEGVVSDMDSIPTLPPTRIWNYSTGLENEVLVSAVADGEGNVYVAGNQAVEGMTFHKFTPEGTRTDWFFMPGESQRVNAATISGNSIIAVGNISGTFEGANGPGYDDFFVMWFSLDGTRTKTKRWGTAVNNRLYDIAVDLDGSVIIIGETQTAVNPATYEYDAYAAKLSPSGEILWETQWQAKNNGVYSKGIAVSMGPNGSVFVSGNVDKDAFTTMLDPEGNVATNNVYDSGYDDVVTDNLYTYDILTLGWSQYPQEEGSAQGFLSDHEFPNDIGRDITSGMISRGEEILVVGSNYYQNAVLWNIGNWTISLSDTGGSIGNALALYQDNIYVGWSDGTLSYVSRWH